MGTTELHVFLCGSESNHLGAGQMSDAGEVLMTLYEHLAPVATQAKQPWLLDLVFGLHVKVRLNTSLKSLRRVAPAGFMRADVCCWCIFFEQKAELSLPGFGVLDGHRGQSWGSQRCVCNCNFEHVGYAALLCCDDDCLLICPWDGV